MEILTPAEIEVGRRKRNTSSRMGIQERIERFKLMEKCGEFSGEVIELWKSMVPCLYYTKKPYEGYPSNPLSGAKYNYEDEQQFVPNWVLIDLKNVQATIGESPASAKKPPDWTGEWYFNEQISDNTTDDYSPNALER